MSDTRTTPDGTFLWGAATAAYQIEGAANAGGRGASIWDVFTHTPGKTSKGDTGDIACDHYHRWREDVSLMRDLRLGAYRFSIAWPRVMPLGRGRVNAAGLDFYERLVDALRGANIEPMVTLYHWDLPAALQDQSGGWEHPDSPNWFCDYARVVLDRLADRVHYWITLNEPWCSVDGGYFSGEHAPGIQDRPLGYRVGHNLLRAHAYAVAAYRAHRHGRGRISFALNTSYSEPASDSPTDRDAAQRAMLDFAGWFADPAWFGDYPALLRDRLGALLPAFTTEDSRLLRRSMDFLALNYYFGDIVRHAPGQGAMEYSRQYDPTAARTEMGWPVTPDLLRKLLHWLSRRYQGLPVYITENGAAMPDRADLDGYVEDADRIGYLRDHLNAVEQARAEGVDVRGYFVWSLMDNLEWSHGFSKRFGLIGVDRGTLKRTIKASGRWYAAFVEAAGAAWKVQPRIEPLLEGVQ